MKTLGKSVSGKVLVLAMCAAMFTAAAGGELIFEFDAVETKELSGFFTTLGNNEVTVDWGDGTRESFSGRRQAYNKDYGEETKTSVRIYASDENILREFQMDSRQADIRFELKGLPRSLTYLSVSGGNAISGELKDLPDNLAFFRVDGRNTIQGELSDLPEALENFRIMGRRPGLVSGDLADLPRTLVSLECFGGNNAVSGDIKDLPEGLLHLFLTGSNRVTGDIGSLPESLLTFRLAGLNSVWGDIGELPGSITHFEYSVSRIPDRRAERDGITGDIAALPAGVITFIYRGREAVFDYTPGREWAEGMQHIEITTELNRYVLATEDYDNLLSDLAETTWTGSKRIIITGSRSRASDAAYIALEEQGVTVE